MAELAVVRRYVRALFDSATRAGQVEQIEADLKGADEIMRSVPRLQRALRAPTITSARKQALLEHTFAARVSPLTLRFLQLVITRRREDILGDVFAEFQRLANEARNLLPVDVAAAVPLTDEERDRLSEALSRRTGKQILLRVSIDPSLLGGLQARMGDTILDSSVKTRLAQLRSRLLAGQTG